MPLGIDVDSKDIDGIAEVLGVSFADEDRRNVLLSTETCDIQACPGSGKTTLLVAKLAILARKWSWRDQGICVLSHTNAARHEVEHRLAGYPSAHRLLGYPHFVGTIQAFVDRFLALPNLRNLGLEVTMVDNDRFAQKAANLIALRKYMTAFNFLKRRTHTRDAMLANLRLEGAALDLTTVGNLPKKDTATYRQLDGLKKAACEDGVFRYDDMYAFAEKYVADHPWVASSVRHRFPWVFVDEMQDTDEIQDSLLRKLFGEGCILQRLGDGNQAIFRGAEVASQTSFPNDGHLGLPESKRFGQAIADRATPLTQAVSPQDLIGNPAVASKQHTVFLFDRDSISQVLAAFGELIAAEYPDGVPAGFVAKAIGFRKNPPDSPRIENMPNAIGDYLNGFDGNQTLSSERPERLIDFIRKAWHLRASSGECKEAADLVCDGVLELLHISRAVDASGLRFTKTRLGEALVEAADELYNRFRAWLTAYIVPLHSLSEEEWGKAVDELRDVLSRWLPGTLPEVAVEFLAWTPTRGATTEEGCAALSPNVYWHESAVGPIAVELSTIHSAKGQTHTATLVLETYFNRNHDLRAVLPLLAGRKKAVTDALRGRMKRVFVGMTRPRELLCLAVRKDHVSDSDAKALSDKGWIIRDLKSTT